MASTGDAGFRVKVYLDADRFEIVSHAGEQWTWPMAEVRVQRAGASRFHLALGKEAVYFTPDEPLGFASDTMGHGEDEPGRRGFLRRQIEAARDTAVSEPTVGEVEWIEDPEPNIQKGRRRAKRHEHEWAEGTSTGVVRRRCVSCGHVSIDITGFVSEFDLGGEMAEAADGRSDHPAERKADDPAKPNSLARAV